MGRPLLGSPIPTSVSLVVLFLSGRQRHPLHALIGRGVVGNLLVTSLKTTRLKDTGEGVGLEVTKKGKLGRKD